MSQPIYAQQINKLLESEILWILDNIDRYNNTSHAQAVVQRITQRYFIKDSRKLVEQFAKDRKSCNMFALFDHFGIDGV